MLSKRTQEVLRTAGWSPSRRVDVSVWERTLQGKGYVSHSAARDFWERFGGLDVTYPYPPDPRLKCHFHTDPVRAAGELYKADVEACEHRVGEPLIFVGEYDHTFILMMTPSGKVYGEADGVLLLFGENSEELLESICQRKVVRSIP